ncbi:putative GPI-anchored protein pfl2 isoform X2 [Daphnia magna]|uniref:putative GPI-anchored protein pfl2 isoform X2 n=1 Tax=Daphnia magna TaxID=35525 RepID=UPI001E1BA6F7|nr:putative GPI-anchored protein pfl2 isoform X2 [Daphnia magna]
MTATIGVTFGAGSAAKRILLFAINVTVLLLGVTCSVLCLYQVKLMPETYDVIVAALLESNLTTTAPAINVIDIRNNINKNGRNTTRSGGSNKGRPRVTPKKGNTTNQHTPVSPVTFITNITSLIESGTIITSSLEVQNLDITKGVALSQTGTIDPLTTGSTMAKSSVTSRNTTVSRVVTPTSLMNTMEETIDFGQVLKNRIAELENELRLAQLREKVSKSIEQENKTSTIISSMISSPIGELDFPDTQASPNSFAITTTATSWPGISISTPATQQLTMSTKTWTISTSEKSSSYSASLISTSSSANAVSSTTTTLSPTSRQTFAITSTVKPNETTTVLTTTPSKTSRASTILAPTTTSLATRLESTPVVSVATSTTSKASQTSTSRTTSAPTSGKTPILTATTKITSAATTRTAIASTTPARMVTEIPKTTLSLISTTSSEGPSVKTSTSETSTAGEVSMTSLNVASPAITSPMPPTDASFGTESQTTSQEQVSSTLMKAITNPTTASLLSPMQTATPLTTLFTATSLSSSVSTERASPSSSMTTTTSRPLSTTNTTISSVRSSTKSLSTSATTPSSMGFINLTNVLDSISKLVGRRDLFKHRLHKRSSASTVPPAIHSADTLTADHIPIYFEQVFFFVQTSLYVCTAAGLLIFFSSLVGICGGLFRIDGCLKFSVAALVLVIMAEMATTAFIFVAHDKASNRNKNKNFDRDLKLLCDLANFCIQPMLLVITGSFLCISVVLQIGSITLACNLMDNRTATDPDKKLRRMMRSSHSNFQFGAGNAQMNPYSNPMPMPMPCCGGGGYGGMNSNLFPYPSPMMMPMQNMGYYPPVFSVPGQRPIVNIIS